jgi:hypothetical protein
MENQFFFPQAALDHWIVEGKVDFRDGELRVADGSVYRLAEAVHIVREVGGNTDAHAIVGHVKARPWLEQMGAEIVETSMLLGDAAYDVEPGWVGTPVGPPPARAELERLAALAQAASA